MFTKRNRNVVVIGIVIMAVALGIVIFCVSGGFAGVLGKKETTTAPSTESTVIVTAATTIPSTTTPQTSALLSTVPSALLSTVPSSTILGSTTVAVTDNPTLPGTPAPSTTSGQLSNSDISPLPTPVIITISESNWLMTLVNRKYRIPDSYTVQRATAVQGYDIELDYRVAPHYQAMYDAAAAEGCYLTPYSGYRRYSTQKTNYQNKTQYYLNQGYNQTEALSLAARIIMPPGSSEHNLGLAMDICGTNYNFDETKEFAWLKLHAADYGFILRYTEEKQTITNVVYEPWHWRYVGVENAKAINASGLCLEEYLGMSSN